MQSIWSKLDNVVRTAKKTVLQRVNAARSGKQPHARATPIEEAPPAPAPKPVSWELRSQAELVDHIEQHYHAGLRRDLPLLIEAARRVERDHVGHPSLPRGLSSLLESFESDLDSHMSKEERILFPTLRTGARGGQLDMPMRMMEREHDSHAEELERIHELTHGLVVPDDASATWKELYAGLATLENDLRQHIYLENNLLFARASGGEY
jgi:regulator of cell morphogenesis and NO signaling